MVRIGRQSTGIAAAQSERSIMPELFGGHFLVAVAAQVLGVTVIVCAAMVERHDVVHDRGKGAAACRQATLAQAIGAFETALPLALPGTATQAFDSHCLSSKACTRAVGLSA
jgi:hypothetical protein